MSKSRGKDLAERLRKARIKYRNVPLPGAKQLPVLSGLEPGGVATASLTNVLLEAQRILKESGKVFAYGEDIVIETEGGEPGNKRLVPLAANGQVEPTATARLTNLFICSTGTGERERQFDPPRRFVSTLLVQQSTLTALPIIRLRASRPIFDKDFVLRGPGFHPEIGLLVHGAEIEPLLPEGNFDLKRRAIERLPPHLRGLLKGFCFKSDADLANAVAALLTGILITHFIEGGKPIFLFDGNQPSLGKTLLVMVIGMVLDGVIPQLIHYTANEDELQKRILSTLRGSAQSILLFDNAKRPGGAISSPAIEANSMAPMISLRILGKSENYVRPNDVLWCITMNDTKMSQDLVSRGVPERFYYEGTPEARDFQGHDPLAYAHQHRAEILGELAGMVLHWNQLGRPEGQQQHRLHHWAKIIGGVLIANGLPEGLTNLQEAAAEFNTAMDDLAALAEAAVARNDKHLVRVLGQKPTEETPLGRSASEWEPVFTRANVATEKLQATRGKQGKATAIGNILGSYVGRTVPIADTSTTSATGKINRTGTAKMCVVKKRANQKVYYFVVEWDDGADKPTTGQPAANNGEAKKTAPAQPSEKKTGKKVASAAATMRPPGKNTESWDG